ADSNPARTGRSRAKTAQPGLAAAVVPLQYAVDIRTSECFVASAIRIATLVRGGSAANVTSARASAVMGEGGSMGQIHCILSFREIKRVAIKSHGRLGGWAVFEMSMNRA